MSKQWLMKSMPVFAMISLQFLYASMSIATKATLDKGFSPLIFLVYRQTASSIFLTPITIITMRRKPAERTMGKKGFFLVFMAAIIGVTLNTNFYYEGLKLASATMASAMSNLIPAVTFLIAAAVGLEKVKLRNIRSMAKVLGTITCVGGAAVMVLLRGQKLLSTDFKGIILSSFLQGAGDQWLLGFFFLVASSTCWSTWLILQVPICKSHLDPLSLSTWMSVISAIQTALLALLIEPDWRVWRADSGLSILICFYTGVCCAVSYFVQSWCIAIRGPLFSAMFSPLCTVITTISASFLLHEELYIGSLVGAAAIIAGLYAVLWGKAEDINGGSKESHYDDDNAIKIRSSEENPPTNISENNLQEPLIRFSDEHC
ncbi:WAT1-related protein At4g30420-like [Phalaenopsis equestris]|uniref:WAT1-related protein At4g30420-like n=1 Tax=Phalaenopsis equestris TaxID=78828 RepID=UPI0009E32B26|nr:WAT1-related protein At4g30420-like [Phalaenopsis equestris]